MNAVDFAYEHFGSKISTESKTAWMRPGRNVGILTKNGKPASSFQSGFIFISESDIVIYGLKLPKLGLDIHHIPPSKFKQNLLFSPPEEPWIALGVGMRAISERSLILNINQNESTIVEESGKSIKRIRPAIVREAAELIGNFPKRDIEMLFSLMGKHLFNKITPNESELLERLSIKHEFQHLKQGVLLMLEHEMDYNVLKDYMSWKESQNV